MPPRQTLIREARLLQHFSQSEIAEKAGISLQVYQRFEYGDRALENCSMKMGLKICEALNLDPWLAVFGTSRE